MKADVTTLDAGSAGSVELPDAVFGLDPRKDILQRMVTYQLAKRQQGTHKTKGRSEVTGTTKKFVNQKGSGGARHGNRKVPQFRGGGKAFGPVVRSHAIDLPKKVRALALKHALSSKVKEDNLIILDDAKMAAPKTAQLRALFGKLGLKSALVIGGSELDANFELAARNIPLVDVLPAQGINVYDILRRDKLVLTKAALESLEARFK
ncbi:MAG: 50S ribosomal protein L4 [Rhodobiaceae bacterium]|nr:50S ribosomal protein L4 [Rhodobiaceae bacterium]